MSSKLVTTEPSIVSSEAKDRPQESNRNVDSMDVLVVTICAEDVEYQSDCIICLDAIEADERVARLLCGHYYHEECVGKWLTTNITCPQCRQTVADNPFYKRSFCDFDDTDSESEELRRLFVREDTEADVQNNVPLIVQHLRDEIVDYITHYDQMVRQWLDSDQEDRDDDDDEEEECF